MFEFHVQSLEMADAMRKIALAIPSPSKNGENEGIKMVFYKKVKAINKSLCLLLAFNGKVQAVSSFAIQEVVSDQDEVEVHISGGKALATAEAFATPDVDLKVICDKTFQLEGAKSVVTLQMAPKIVAIKQEGPPLQEIEMNREDLVEFVNFAASCYGEEKGSRGLHCVGIRIDEKQKKMIAVSSNGTRCAYAETSKLTLHQAGRKKEGKGQTPPATVIVEGKILKNAVKNLSKKKVVIGIDTKRIQIKSGTDVVIILTQDIPFPMDAVLQAVLRCKRVGAWKAKLSNVLQALAIYEITMETPWLSIRKKSDVQVCLQGKDELTSAAVLCAQEGDLQNIALDEKEFKSALSIFSKDRDILIETMTASDPVVIRQHEEDPNRIIVMPVSEE